MVRVRGGQEHEDRPVWVVGGGALDSTRLHGGGRLCYRRDSRGKTRICLMRAVSEVKLLALTITICEFMAKKSGYVIIIAIIIVIIIFTSSSIPTIITIGIAIHTIIIDIYIFIIIVIIIII